jgi:hypothetical protein
MAVYLDWARQKAAPALGITADVTPVLTLTKESTTIKLRPGSTTLTINNVKNPNALPAAPELQGAALVCAPADILQKLGYNLNTVGSTITVTASNSPPPGSDQQLSVPNFAYFQISDPSIYGKNLELIDGWLSVVMNGFQIVNSAGRNLVDTEVLNYIGTLEAAARQAFVDKYIFARYGEKRLAKLCLPIQSLANETLYTVRVPAGIIQTKEGGPNEALTWNFDTLYRPTMNWISQDTVGEEYDPDIPLLIRGDNFYMDHMEVIFIETGERKRTYRGDVDATIWIDKAGNKYVKIYLPSGGNRLPAGVYNVELSNGSDYYTILNYALTVIRTEDYPYTAAGQRIISNTVVGRVLADPFFNLDSLELSGRVYRNGKIDVDLDRMMGAGVREREITFPVRRGTVMQEVYANSRYGDIAAYNVQAATSDEEATVTLRVGRAPLSVSAPLKLQLGNVQVVSDFIEVTGENMSLSGVYVRIPCLVPTFDAVKALRYDTVTRRWEELPYEPDWVNQQAIFYSRGPGVFVLVQGGI